MQPSVHSALFTTAKTWKQPKCPWMGEWRHDTAHIKEHSLNKRNVGKVKATQSCPTLCNPTDYTVNGILHAKILEWVACPFSSRSSQPRNQTGVSCTTGGFFTNWATREYYSAIKKNEMTSTAATWMDLEITILSEVKTVK